MPTRRNFMAALTALPFIGKLITPKPAAPEMSGVGRWVKRPKSTHYRDLARINAPYKDLVLAMDADGVMRPNYPR